jgi:hypothetical protein
MTEEMLVMKKTIRINFCLWVVLGVILALPAFGADNRDAKPAGRQFYELRIYTFTAMEQHAVVENYWEI